MASEYSGIYPLPDDILAEIFLRLPSLDVVRSCVLVCKDWNRVANTQTLWKDKCVRDHQFPEDLIKLLAREDFKVLCFKNPYCRNLIRNPDANLGMEHWKVTQNKGSGWRTEVKPIGTDPVEKFVERRYKRRDRCIGCWVTSFYDCMKEQLVDLVKEGCSVQVLDSLRPDIIISEWFAARADCGIHYELTVQLLGAVNPGAGEERGPDYSQPLDEYHVELNKEAGRVWYPVKHTFSGYPSGLRYIRYIHGGKDTYFWAGHYGAKITLSTAKFHLNHCSGTLQ